MGKEVWKPLIYHGEDFGDTYEISNTGKLRNFITGKERKLSLNKQGYLHCVISRGRSRKIAIKIHRAVAENFVSGNKEGLVVNHKDGNKENNCQENLEWVTYSRNTGHAYDIGLIGKAKKVKCVQTGQIFRSMGSASKWCGLDKGAIRAFLENPNRNYAGRHPITKEKLTWEAVD